MVRKVGRTQSLWQDAPSAFTKRSCFLRVYGDTGTGKTTFVGTAPGPIAFLHSGDKVDGIVQPFHHKIGPHGDGTGGMFDFNFIPNGAGNPKLTMTEAMKVWEGFKRALSDAVGWARTVVIDTDTEAWELCQYASLGQLGPGGSKMGRLIYQRANAEWWPNLKRVAKHEGVNLVIVSETKDEYKGGDRTGRTVAKGQASMGFKADVVVRTSKKRVKRQLVFSSEVEKAWMNEEAYNGMVLEGAESNFANVLGLVTETDPQEWAV